MTGNKGTHIGRLLRTCAEIEAASAIIYRIFATLHRDEPRVAALWAKTADEEDNHQRQFELGLRLAHKTISGTLVDNEKADQILRQLAAAIEKIRATPPGIESALKFAIDMETKLSTFHMETAVLFVSDYYRTMFRSMMNSDRDHIQALKDCLADYVNL